MLPSRGVIGAHHRHLMLHHRQLFFRCPTCLHDLAHETPRELRCGSGHSVAVASSGHVHLLPAGRLRTSKASRGDTKEMLRARRAFFDASGYRVQIAAVASAVTEAMARHSAGPDLPLLDAASTRGGSNVLDAGCGEGNYLRALGARLAARGVGASLWGTDISKVAVRYAAAAQRSARFAVARSTRLPFADAAFDCVLSVFAPVPWAEFCRVLRPGGTVVVARPGTDHLNGLKAALYSSVRLQKPFESTPPEAAPSGGAHAFAEEARTRSRSVETFRGEVCTNLLHMTPFYWAATEQQQRQIGSAPHLAELTTAVDFDIRTYRLGSQDGSFQDGSLDIRAGVK